MRMQWGIQNLPTYFNSCSSQSLAQYDLGGETMSNYCQNSGTYSSNTGYKANSRSALAPPDTHQGKTDVKRFPNETTALAIYPNPGSDYVYLRVYSSKPSNSNVDIVDVNGQLVYKGQFATTEGQNTIKLNLSNLQQGVYSISISNEQGSSLANGKLVMLK